MSEGAYTRATSGRLRVRRRWVTGGWTDVRAVLLSVMMAGRSAAGAEAVAGLFGCLAVGLLGGGREDGELTSSAVRGKHRNSIPCLPEYVAHPRYVRSDAGPV